MPSDPEWLDINRRTLFRLGANDRIEGENDPDNSPGPHFWLGGCARGLSAAIHADVPDDVAAELYDLIASEPPFTHPSTPRHLDRYLALLDGSADHGYLIYELPCDLPCPPDQNPRVSFIDSESTEGSDLLRAWSAHGVPPALRDLGFRDDASDFWAPWCVAMLDGHVASIAFAARLSDTGAELGLATVKTFRGMGLAAAATAGWSRLPTLRSRTLFYSTDRDNLSSRRVATRLGLHLRGASLRIV